MPIRGEAAKTFFVNPPIVFTCPLLTFKVPKILFCYVHNFFSNAQQAEIFKLFTSGILGLKQLVARGPWQPGFLLLFLFVYILHELHETCHSVTFIVLVNSHQR